MKKLAIIVLGVALINVLLAVMAGLGTRMAWWDFPVGFSLLKVAFYSAWIAGGVAFVLSLVGFMNQSPIQRALGAFVLSCFVIIIPFSLVQTFRTIPTYADATTDFENPPVFELLAKERKTTAKNPLEYRAGEAEGLQRKYFPDLRTLTIKDSVAEANRKTREALSEMGLHLAPGAVRRDRVEATATSFWFGFKDDVVVVFTSLPDGSTQVNVRSASRVGKLDGGANAKRVAAVLARLRHGPSR